MISFGWLPLVLHEMLELKMVCIRVRHGSLVQWLQPNLSLLFAVPHGLAAQSVCQRNGPSSILLYSMYSLRPCTSIPIVCYHRSLTLLNFGRFSWAPQNFVHVQFHAAILVVFSFPLHLPAPLRIHVSDFLTCADARISSNSMKNKNCNIISYSST